MSLNGKHIDRFVIDSFMLSFGHQLFIKSIFTSLKCLINL